MTCRHSFPLLVVSWLLLAGALEGDVEGAEATTPQRPNVLFILADDLGWADTTLYGHTKFYRTPHLERLARRGMTFTRAYSASPLCSPTRSSILTGLSPARTGITTPNCHVAQVVLRATTGTAAPPDKKSIQPNPPTRLRTEYVTLAETLKSAGYATGHFGKWHLGATPYSPLEQGFDVDVPHWPGPGPAGSYVAPWRFPDFDPQTPDQHIEDRMAKEAVAFMEKHRREPFFLNYWMFSVHAPFDAKKALVARHRARVNPADPQRCPTYAAMVESMDDAVGTLLDALDRLGIAGRTIVVFTSDNGGNMYDRVDGVPPTSNAPLRGGKATVYEGGIRVPCVVAWPGVVPGGSHSDAVVQSVDYYPTLLEMLSLSPQAGPRFDGVSIVPALRGGPLRREAIFTYFPHDPAVPDWLPPAVAVHCGDWKLIRIFHGGDRGAHRWKLFNLRDDPGEKNDLAGREPQRVEQLDARIERFLGETKAVVPVPNPRFNPAVYHPEEEGKQKFQPPGKPRAKAKSKAVEVDDPRLQGWKARNCNAVAKNGIVTVTGRNDAPFLGVGAGASGPAVVSIRARSQRGGPGKVEWILPGTKPAEARLTPFALKPGGWDTVVVRVPAEGPIAILRVYLPAQQQPVEIDWIEMKAVGKTKRWEF